MLPLQFDVNGETLEVPVRTLLNAGYAGRSQSEVASHVAELVELGVPAPSRTPALYPVAPYLARQTDRVPAQHDQTSGEAEWAIVITGERDEDVLITAACDHTDRALEVHGVAWSKNAAPDILAARAWRLVDVADRLDVLTLTAWAGPARIQQGTLGDLLAPKYWLDVLRERDLHRPGTVLLSGTIPMDSAVDQFSDSWQVQLGDPATGESLDCGYRVERLPDPLC